MAVLDGKVVIVTGGSLGVGRGIAYAMSGEGAKLVICGRTEATLTVARAEMEARGGEAFAVVCDVANREERERLVAETLGRFGAIDVLVNNAAYVPNGLLLDTDEAEIQKAWEAGPVASLHLMKLCFPHLKGGGCVINISSNSAISAVSPQRGAYAAVKAALNAFSRAAAMEWGKAGVRVNTIMPIARSEGVERFIDAEPELARKVFEALPLGRLGDAEADIGPVAVFLASSAASYLTGLTITADGGHGYLR
jgi:meso-butanediol dehydrogenase/(S,S)-butanediol dehydrogenase/diacetyl reductase